MQTINLDLSVRSIIPLLHVKQGDVGRKFKAILTDGGADYPVPAGAAVSVWYSGASGEGNYTDIGADSAVSVSENEITVELITQMLANYGEGKLCLAINTADGDQIGTWNIPYMVEPLPGMGSAAAQAYFTAFSQAVQNLPYPDNTLSVAGKAADAEAVGTALAGKAPAGYGLGEHSVYTADCHSITENGWYFTDVSTLNAPPESQYGTILAKTRGDALVLEYTDIDGGIKAQAVRMGSGTWGDWDFENPPMYFGVEYRTTERWNGKAVWTALINLGQLTTGKLTVDTGIEVTNVIRHNGTATGSWSKVSLPSLYTLDTIDSWGQWIGTNISNNGTVSLTAYRGSDYGAEATIYCQLWYTKD